MVCASSYAYDIKNTWHAQTYRCDLQILAQNILFGGFKWGILFVDIKNVCIVYVSGLIGVAYLIVLSCSSCGCVCVCVRVCVFCQFRNSFIFVCQYAKYFTIKIVILWFASIVVAVVCSHVFLIQGIFWIFPFADGNLCLSVLSFLFCKYVCLFVICLFFRFFWYFLLFLFKFALPIDLVYLNNKNSFKKMQNQIIPIIRQAAMLCFCFNEVCFSAKL